MTGTFNYVASPYSDPAKSVRNDRFLEAMKFVRWLLLRREWSYSPIVHCHPLAVLSGLPTDFAFWQAMNHCFIDRSRGVYVLRIPGWDQSKGVADEMAYAAETAKPVTHFAAVDGGYEVVG